MELPLKIRIFILYRIHYSMLVLVRISCSDLVSHSLKVHFINECFTTRMPMFVSIVYHERQVDGQWSLSDRQED
jgi:hypothetical protein